MQGSSNSAVLRDAKLPNFIVSLTILRPILYRLSIMKTSCYFTPALGWLVDHEHVYMCYNVVNTSGSIMEQRTASKHVGNVPTALISCRIFIGPMSYSGWLQLDVLMYAKRRKVHADDNGAIVLLTNPTSFIGII